MDIKQIASEAGIKVLELIDLLDYDGNMGKLYSYLKKYQDYCFSQNERLVFIYNDTDFIVSNVRFSLYNLQLLLFKLQIPNFSVIVVGQYELTESLHYLNSLLTNDEHPIRSIFFEGHCLHYPPPTVKCNLNHTLIEKNFIFLSNIARTHRLHFYSWLKHSNLLDSGLVSFRMSNAGSAEEDNSTDSSQPVDLKFLYTKPFTRINENWICRDTELLHIFSSTPKEDYKNFAEENTSLTNTNDDLLQRAFCYISNETVFNYPTYTSEKSFKCFSSMRPMISFGPPGILQRLRNLGFKTWDNWWSEEYDTIEDHTERFKAVTNLVKQISRIPLDQCKLMLEDMLPILVHNQTHYIDKFLELQRSLLYNGFRQNQLK